LRGWIELELIERSFLFADNNSKLLDSDSYSELYLLEIKSRQPTRIPGTYLQELSYKNNEFSVFKLKLIE
jgi:hypothetical protein